MQARSSLTEKIRTLAALTIVVLLWLAYAGLQPLWADETPGPALAPLATSAGRLAFGLYLLLTLLSVGTFVLGLRKPGLLQQAGERLYPLRWVFAGLTVALLAWLYLFSPLQARLSGPWTALPAAAALARLLAWAFRPAQARPYGWEETALAFGLYLFPRVVQEMRIIYPSALVSRGTTLAGFLLLLVLIWILHGPHHDRILSWLLRSRERLGKRARIMGWILLLTPLAYRYILGAGGYILYPNIRFVVFLLALAVAAYLLNGSSDRLVSLKSVAEAVGWLALVAAVIRVLLLVVAGPFSLSWSEGNRFYDYSLIFGQDLYDHAGQIVNPYESPGRYILWGVLFAFRGLPIWVHRLWNAALLAAPSLLLAWILTRKLESRWRAVLFLWVSTFFIVIAPLHPPFMLLLIIVAAFAFHPSPAVRGASLVAASLYASLSRWTWVVAPGAWGALIDLFLYYPSRRGNWLQRLLPTCGMALLGAAPGLLMQAGYLRQFSSGGTLTSSQPLLWYRLLPNPTLGPGVALLMLFTTGPLVVVLAYQVASRRWKLDLFQSLALWGTLAAFLGAGLVISTKIGGGGDLHNLDMYIGTLMLVTSLLLRSQPGASSAQAQPLASQPGWVWALIVLLALQPIFPFTPFSSSANYNKWLDLPTPAESAATLSRIRQEVEAASQHGEVLFMDQRQLLTFGYIPPVPFVDEYEKKYMMDQAMGGNAGYFLPYYQDLQKKRFSLIVTEVLRAGLKQEGGFSEENNAWVEWVSTPTLCFYEPIMTDKVVGVQLLVPRPQPEGCEQYLQGAAP